MTVDAPGGQEVRSSLDRTLDRFFGYRALGSSLRTEVLAGITTFMTMAYILFVNPSVLAGGAQPIRDPNGVVLDSEAVLTSTALVAGLTTLLMGLLANYPFALAAGLGLNGVVAFQLVAAERFTWPQAMGLVVVEGVLIFLLVLTGLREAVMNAIPMALKRAIGVGIGLFITLIGFSNAGFVVRGEATPVTIGPLDGLRVAVFVVGLLLTAALVARGVRGALLLGILGTTVLAIAVNEARGGTLWPQGVATLPDQVIGTPDFSLLGKASPLGGFATQAVAAAVAVFALMLSDFFDTMGTVIGLGEQGGLLDERGRLPRINRVLLVDSAAAALGGAASASSSTSYIEASSGIAVGGRTGLTAVVVAALFFLSLLLSPLAGVIPPEATAPALILVGFFMLSLVRDIQWDEVDVALPAFLTIVLMPFTFSITNGIGAGFIAYTVLKASRGRIREVHPLLIIVSLFFLAYFAIEPIRELLGV